MPSRYYLRVLQHFLPEKEKKHKNYQLTVAVTPTSWNVLYRAFHRCSMCAPRVNMGVSVIFTLLMRVWQELEYCIDVCRVTRGAHIEHLYLSKQFFSFPVAINNFIMVYSLVSFCYKCL
jgi:hypothetical protein